MNTNLAYLSHNTSIYLVYSEHTELKDVKNKVICIAMCMYLVFLFATLATLRSVKNYPFWQFLVCFITDRDAEYCRKW